MARARAARVGVGIMAERRPVPSDLFPLVLAFLRESGCQGAARAFAREAAAVSGEREGAGESGKREGAGRGLIDRPTDWHWLTRPLSL